MVRASRWLAFLAVLWLPGAARADVDGKLTAYETEARQLGTDLPQPNQSSASGPRRLVDAEVAFSLGDYNTAALMLFDLASKPGADQETATYYLGESLFQKGDKGGGRTYFAHFVASKNSASRYFQPSLQRLVEIAISQGDFTDSDQYVSQLDRLAAGLYIRGKYAFAQGKLDEAITYFTDVPKGSDYELPAQYYLGTANVAKKDLARATEVFTSLTERNPKASKDKRVVELSQLALGRLYYERDQFSKSIDSYLLVDRHSDLFPDALYEVAWVYVKGKQYDKALRALELLSLSDPTSNKSATVRILDGNLRIRKAQMIRDAEITGTQLDSRNAQDPVTEYDKAAQVFTETHDIYMPSYVALSQMVDSNANPEQYLAQIAGRSTHVFQATSPIPEAAAQYLRDEPEVQRVVAVENDLGEIQSNLNEAEATIARLEGVIGAGDKAAGYPALQARRSRIGQIQDDLIAIRNELAEGQLRLVDSSGDLSSLSGTRKSLAKQYAETPNAEQTRIDRIAAATAQYDTIDQASAEISAAIDSTQAVAVALRKFANDPPVEGQTPIPADQKTAIAQALDTAATESQAIENELQAIHREVTLGRDLAGVGDETVIKARALRAQLRVAQDAEHRVLAGFAGTSRDTKQSRVLAGLGDRAARIADALDQAERQIDGVVEKNLAEAKVIISQERANVATYKAELDSYEREARSLGGTVLGASFKAVKAKFYDVIIRTDIGNVDVVWSQKEDADDDLKRLNLSRQRELKQLKDEFKDILNGGVKTPATPAVPTPNLPPSTGPTGSPDKGGGETRIKPGTDAPQGTPLPTVKPDLKGGAR